jgi:putative acetyltransferase
VLRIEAHKKPEFPSRNEQSYSAKSLVMSSFSIVDYADEYHSAFKSLNVEWLLQFNLLEPRDLEALDNPRETILDGGGVIYLAIAGADVIGTAAVMVDHGEYELAKMTVAKSHRGKGVSKILLERCIQYAISCKADKLILYSNHQLTSALRLYESYGFKHIEFRDAPFATADVKMELDLVKN